MKKSYIFASLLIAVLTVFIFSVPNAKLVKAENFPSVTLTVTGAKYVGSTSTHGLREKDYVVTLNHPYTLTIKAKDDTGIKWIDIGGYHNSELGPGRKTKYYCRGAKSCIKSWISHNIEFGTDKYVGEAVNTADRHKETDVISVTVQGPEPPFATPANWKTYRDTDLGFEIKYPPEAKVSCDSDTSSGKTVVFSFPVRGDMFDRWMEIRIDNRRNKSCKSYYPADYPVSYPFTVNGVKFIKTITDLDYTGTETYCGASEYCTMRKNKPFRITTGIAMRTYRSDDYTGYPTSTKKESKVFTQMLSTLKFLPTTSSESKSPVNPSVSTSTQKQIKSIQGKVSQIQNALNKLITAIKSIFRFFPWIKSR